MTLLELLEDLVKYSSMPEKKKADARELLRHLRAINAFGNAVNAQTGEHDCDWRIVQGTYDYIARRTSPTIRICKICNEGGH